MLFFFYDDGHWEGIEVVDGRVASTRTVGSNKPIDFRSAKPIVLFIDLDMHMSIVFYLMGFTEFRLTIAVLRFTIVIYFNWM